MEEYLLEMQNLCHMWQNIVQSEELGDSEDLVGLPEDMVEKLGRPKKERNVRRQFLKWFFDWLEHRTKRKIAKTYMKEVEEGDEIYSSKIFQKTLKTTFITFIILFHSIPAVNDLATST